MKNDESFEELMKVALGEYAEATATQELKTEDELRAEGIEPHTFSPEFERKIGRLIRKTNRAARWQKRRKNRGRMAATIIVLIGVVGATIASVDAFRIPLLTFLIRLDQTHSIVEPERDKQSISKKFDKYLPTYMPDEYAISEVQDRIDGVNIKYSNGHGDFFLFQFRLQLLPSAIDTEKGQVEELTIQGFPAVLVKKDNRTMVTWGANKQTYYLSGYLPREEAITLLESIEIF